ncbi:hypothetical protein JXB11_00595 [Candidatus Woesearchaeota archaeon]|nr:hypothetical protein [Candidatus Woesearchaeota archaeon]
MATFLDTVLLEKLSVVFTWLVVFVVAFGVAEVTNILKNRTLNAIFAISIAFLVGFSQPVTSVIAGFAPWAVIIGFFFLFLLLLGNFLGFPTSGAGSIIEVMGGKGAIWWVLVPLFIAFAFTLSGAFGQQLLEERTGPQDTTTAVDGGSVASSEHEESVIVTLTNPKVLGLMLVFIIGLFTILFLTGAPPIPK